MAARFQRSSIGPPGRDSRLGSGRATPSLSRQPAQTVSFGWIRRAPGNRKFSYDRTVPAQRLWTHGYGNDNRRSESVYKTVEDVRKSGSANRYRAFGIHLRGKRERLWTNGWEIMLGRN